VVEDWVELLTCLVEEDIKLLSKLPFLKAIFNLIGLQQFLMMF
jgi:hypothetical protein